MSGFVGFDKYIRSYNLYGVFKISIFHFQRAVPPHVLAALMGHANGSFSWPAFAPLQLSSSCHSDETIIIISPCDLAGIFLVYDVGTFSSSPGI